VPDAPERAIHARRPGADDDEIRIVHAAPVWPPTLPPTEAGAQLKATGFGRGWRVSQAFRMPFQQARTTGEP